MRIDTLACYILYHTIPLQRDVQNAIVEQKEEGKPRKRGRWDNTTAEESAAPVKKKSSWDQAEVRTLCPVWVILTRFTRSP